MSHMAQPRMPFHSVQSGAFRIMHNREFRARLVGTLASYLELGATRSKRFVSMLPFRTPSGQMSTKGVLTRRRQTVCEGRRTTDSSPPEFVTSVMRSTKTCTVRKLNPRQPARSYSSNSPRRRTYPEMVTPQASKRSGDKRRRVLVVVPNVQLSEADAP